MTKLAVLHTTRYTYQAPVSQSYGQVCLVPRTTHRQLRMAASVSIEPFPVDQSERVDFFGNQIGYFQISEWHETLTITARSEVDVDRPELGPGAEDAANQPLGLAVGYVDSLDSATAVEVAQFRLDSAKVVADDKVRSFAGPSFASDRPTIECLLDLAGRIHRDFRFSSAATDAMSTIDDLFAAGAGVCQDFAHLAVASIRSAGLPARYVSGYLETEPPPGSARLVGVDASHAWASAWLPGVGWVDIDPTNDQLVDDRYVTVAWGRDYDDVAPVKGVIFSNSQATTLEVGVDVTRIVDASA